MRGNHAYLHPSHRYTDYTDDTWLHRVGIIESGDSSENDTNENGTNDSAKRIAGITIAVITAQKALDGGPPVAYNIHALPGSALYGRTVNFRILFTIIKEERKIKL